MLLHWRANLADQNKQQLQKINMSVTHHTNLSIWNKPLIVTCQYCSTSRANQALRSLANVVFQNRGVCQAFPSFFSPSPLFHFWLSFHFSRGQNRKVLSSVFPCSETKRKRLLRRPDDSLKLRFPWRRFICGTDWVSHVWSIGSVEGNTSTAFERPGT